MNMCYNIIKIMWGVKMFCRVCGNSLNDKAEICVSCGCKPLNGKEYCQECGEKTTEKQEMCVKCGCKLRTLDIKPVSFWDNFSSGAIDNEVVTEPVDADFSSLPPYYQQEFQKIRDSKEVYKGKFNLWGFLFGAIWALTKGCWLSAIVCFAISFITAGIGGVVYWFVYGFRGTYMYYCAYVKNDQKVF